MPSIKDNSIEALKDHVNLLDVVEPYVSLKSMGSGYVGLSPFTNEKTPSFYVYPDRGFFKCFSSDYGGDAIKFIQLIENLTFVESLEHLAEKFQFTLEYANETQNAPQERSLRKQLLEIHEFALKFFHEHFLENTTQGEQIRRYWIENRGFALETANEYKMGFAPTDPSLLFQKLKQKRYPPEALLKCGLFYGSQHDRLRCRFRGRLMIPIRDIQGRVIAFSGRQTELTPQDHESEQAKYINSPETPLFSKKNMLFNLDRARPAAKEEDRFLLVEGQLDAIRCYEIGKKCAVAPQGTGFSETQVQLLKRYTNRLECLFDGDGPGQKAALRLIQLAYQQEVEISILPLSVKEDPDELLKAQGMNGLKQLEENALSAQAFTYQYYLPNPEQADTAQRFQALEKCCENIRLCTSSIKRDECIAELSRLSGTDRSSLEKDFYAGHAGSHRSEASMRPPLEGGNNQDPWLTTVEEELLLFILHYEELGQSIAHKIDQNWVCDNNSASYLLTKILAEIEADMWSGPQDVHEITESEEEKSLIYTLLAYQPNYEEPSITANHIIKALHKKYTDRKISEHKNKLVGANSEESGRIMMQIRELRHTLSKTPQLPHSR